MKNKQQRDREAGHQTILERRRAVAMGWDHGTIFLGLRVTRLVQYFWSRRLQYRRFYVMDMSHLPSNHYGKIIASREVGGLTVTENTYVPRLRLPKHTHEQACFCLVLQGRYTETYQQTTLTCEPRSLIFRPAGEAHSDRFSDEAVRCFIIEFETGWLDRVRKHGAKLDGPTTFQQNSLVWLAVGLRQ